MKTRRLFFYFTLGGIVIACLFLTYIYITSNEIARLEYQIDSIQSSRLQDEKTKQEIIKLIQENKKKTSIIDIIPAIVAFFTGIAALIGIFITISNFLEDRKNERAHQEAQRLQSEGKSLRQSDEKLASIISNMSSSNELMQTGAAVSLLLFLEPQYKEFQSQVYLLILSYLKYKDEEGLSFADSNKIQKKIIYKTLLIGFEKALNFEFAQEINEHSKSKLDFSNITLRGTNIKDAMMKGIDFNYADISGSTFENADFSHSIGSKVVMDGCFFSKVKFNNCKIKDSFAKTSKFAGCELISSDLKNTDFADAQFLGCKMQSAHFEKSIFKNVKFSGSNINDMFFKGAIFDENSKNNLLKAENWEKAHYDDGLLDELIALSKR